MSMSDSQQHSCHGGNTCSCKIRVQGALQKYFKFDSFRPGQLEAALAVLHRNDIFVSMATGSGKSLCMFLGPLAKSDAAIGVIISPLTGLMEQQVNLLREAGITALRVGIGCSMYEAVSVGEFRFVFMSPEVAVNPPWRNILRAPHFKEHLALVAIDEAHCIPEWGSDFRTSFSAIGGLRALTDVPFMALSASAPPLIMKTINESLHLKSPVHVAHDLDRPNIFLSWSKSKGLPRDLAGVASMLSMEEEMPKTLIFCCTKTECAKVYNYLRKSSQNGNTISMYHASLTQTTRSQVQKSFQCGQPRCLSATIAFGMGMDIPDIELVIVNGIPDTISQLYQLCGRAGRAGCQSRAHLIVKSDVDKINDSELKRFCTDTENCLRSTMVGSLGCTVRPGNCLCCMACNPSAFPVSERLTLLRVGKAPPRKKRRVAVRKVNGAQSDSIKERLKAERANYISDHPTLAIIGAEQICPTSVIVSVCNSVKFISTLGDMDCFGLRKDLKQRFLSVIMSEV